VFSESDFWILNIPVRYHDIFVRRVGWTGHVAHVGEKCVYKVSARKPETAAIPRSRRRIILNCRNNMGGWGLGSSGWRSVLCARQWTLRFHKTLGTFPTAERLLALQGVGSMDFVTVLVNNELERT
jgi:hypothetical protein